MKILDAIACAFNTRTKKLAWVFILSCIVLNWPIVLFFLPEEARKQISTAAYFLVMSSVGAALFSVKDLQQTGGSKPTTVEAAERIAVDEEMNRAKNPKP